MRHRREGGDRPRCAIRRATDAAAALSLTALAAEGDGGDLAPPSPSLRAVDHVGQRPISLLIGYSGGKAAGIPYQGMRFRRAQPLPTAGLRRRAAVRACS